MSSYLNTKIIDISGFEFLRRNDKNISGNNSIGKFLEFFLLNLHKYLCFMYLEISRHLDTSVFEDFI